ncbi:hypothetical protein METBISCDRAFT_12623 [Metschnikowia bicuspidata]|uniref:Fork-head domain-containing protein n=1 Tax=Metschnikowia bicuspidata TaxID=27322 RepID=A0A4P9ZGX4_9ASCO|nr:hypothetical protein METBISCDRAFT_12623 [Metschnikowia bicuspidata]
MSDNKRTREDTPVFDDPADLVNAVISTLNAPQERTNVSIAYSNDKNVATEVQAYAKIAGCDWTYYVKKLLLTIGRNTEVAPGQQQAAPPVDIDLGLAKVVSRKHVVITYNIDLRCWELKVLGRNGARMDGNKLPVGPDHATPLHLGAILDVGGTQMMFILPDAPPTILQRMLSECLARYCPEKNKFPRIASGQGPLAARTPVDFRSVSYLGVSSFQMFGKSHLAHLSSSVSAVSLQNNLDQDLSKEGLKDIKPPYSYATMITQAILSNLDGVMSLSEIYNWISSHYAYYKYSKTGWQNSIRHNLSLNKAFEKVPRRPNEPGKGMKWQISELYRNDFIKKIQNGTILKLRRGSSVSRTLQIHLATHQGLPEPKLYLKHDSAQPASNCGSYMDQMAYATRAPFQIDLNRPDQGPQYSRPPSGAPNAPGMLMQPNYMAPAATQESVAKPKHLDGASHMYMPTKPLTAHTDSPSYVPGLTYKGSGASSQPQTSYELAGDHVGQTSFANTSNLPNTSESMQNLTAPTTSNSTELGLGFTSPKKIAPLEAFTPERGSKVGPKNAGSNQSSPVFWNFVQFSTPNGQTPGRKNSDEGNVQVSPTLVRSTKGAKALASEAK